MGRDSFDPRLICVHDWEDGRVLYVHMHDRSDSLIDACSISGHMHEAQPITVIQRRRGSLVTPQFHWPISIACPSCNLQRYSRDGRRLINLNRQVAAQGHADTSFRM